MKTDKRMEIALLALRLTVFLVLLMWTVDKFAHPQHAAAIMNHFYALKGFGIAAVYTLGVLELILLAAFVAGLARRYSYGLVLILHAASTFAAWREYFHPFAGENLLFFAAWPMLAACLALYLLRDNDALSVDGRRVALKHTNREALNELEVL